MPYSHERKKIPRNLDRRVKLTEDDKAKIKKMHAGGMAIRAIAREFENKCSRRTIQYVIRPELYDHLRHSFKERRKDGRYKPEKSKWAEIMREHRRYKQTIKDKLI